jgi:hypothetical protein
VCTSVLGTRAGRASSRRRAEIHADQSRHANQ